MACIVAEFNIGEFSATRLVTDVDEMIADCVLPDLVSNLAGESEKWGFEGVGFGTAIN